MVITEEYERNTLHFRAPATTEGLYKGSCAMKTKGPACRHQFPIGNSKETAEQKGKVTSVTM